MPEPTSEEQEEYEHLLSDVKKDLEIYKGRLLQEEMKPQLASVDDELIKTIEEILKRLSLAGKDPESIFKVALTSLEDVDGKRFLIENMLEAMKLDKTVSLESILDRYKVLGLLTKETPREAKDIHESGDGKIFQSLLSRLRIFGRDLPLTLMQLPIAPLKFIAQDVEIQPNITVFPVPALSLAIKGPIFKVSNLHEKILNTLRQG